VVVVIFLVLALTSGGDSFRWFGDTVRDVSHEIGEVADLLDQATKDIKNASHTIRQTGEKLRDIAEETGEKATGIVNSTGIVNTTEDMVGEIKNAVSEVAPNDEDKPKTKSEKKRKRTATKNVKDQ
jgi:Sec-independent protein translocase protein TatA